MTLYEKIHELEEKKQSLVDEANSKGTPAEEREKLLKQVSKDEKKYTYIHCNPANANGMYIIIFSGKRW